MKKLENFSKNTGNVTKGMVIAIIIGILSCIVADYISAPERHKKAIDNLQRKQNTVMELMAASTATSAAITLLPDDTATPIAEKLTDLSTGFLIILTAIFLEKYLLTISLWISFKIIIPVVCILSILYMFIYDVSKRERIKAISKKLIMFGLVLCLAVPVSLGFSNLIESTYQTSIDETINNAKNIVNEVQEEESIEKEENVPSSIFSKVTGFAEDIAVSVTGTLNKAKYAIGNFIEAIAIFIVTTCILPVIVMMILVSFAKNLLGSEQIYIDKYMKKDE